MTIQDSVKQYLSTNKAGVYAVSDIATTLDLTPDQVKRALKRIGRAVHGDTVRIKGRLVRSVAMQEVVR